MVHFDISLSLSFSLISRISNGEKLIPATSRAVFFDHAWPIFRRGNISGGMQFGSMHFWHTREGGGVSHTFHWGRATMNKCGVCRPLLSRHRHTTSCGLANLATKRGNSWRTVSWDYVWGIVRYLSLIWFVFRDSGMEMLLGLVKV